MLPGWTTKLWGYFLSSATKRKVEPSAMLVVGWFLTIDTIAFSYFWMRFIPTNYNQKLSIWFMPIRPELEDFYVPSLTARNRKSLNKYSLQIIIIVLIFGAIMLTDASRLKEFITKLTNLLLLTIKGMFMLLEFVW